MIRQNKDGRPIYNDSVWNQMVEIGQKLRKLEYKESRTKPNLFFKPIETKIKSKDDKLTQVRGVSL